MSGLGKGLSSLENEETNIIFIIAFFMKKRISLREFV